MSLKVALVGCGKIADGHVEEIAKMPELARVMAVCDREPLMAEQIAMRYGLPAHYHCFETLLATEKPDVVHITTPPASHLPLAIAAIDAGCHVYVEKPLTLCHADSRTLLDHGARARRRVTVGYTYFFDPPAIAMRQLIAEGAVGDVVHAESFYGYDLSGAYGSAILSDEAHWVHGLPGQLLHNNIDHLLNKTLELVEDERPAVHARGLVRRARRYGDRRDDMLDELRVLIQGERTSAYATFSAHARPIGHFVRVYGTRNTMHVDYLSRSITLETPSRLPSAVGRLLPAFGQAWQHLRAGGANVLRFARSEFHFMAGLNHLIAAFYRSILEDRPAPLSDRDMLRVSALMDEIFRQLAAAKTSG